MTARRMMSEAGEDLLRHIRISYWRLFQALENGVADDGATSRELLCLELLDEEGPMSGRALSLTLGMTPANITRLTVPMEEKKWIQRVRDPDDHRRLLISLCGAGRSVLQTSKIEHEERLSHLLACLTPQELSVISKGLQGFLSALEPNGHNGRGSRL
jgi:DNA-binding MarR family transcriptional regulator